MKHAFTAFPEYIAVDSTCQFSQLEISLYIILVEDGNCDSEVVAFGILSDDVLEAVDWFFSVFKTKNAVYNKTLHILTEKSLTEKCVLKKYFPKTDLLLCVFHILRTFSKKINAENYPISVDQKTECLKLFQKMQKSETEEEFQKNLCLFNQIAPDFVKDFYYKNWHYIRAEWCSFADIRKSNFLHSTNSRVEFIHAKLKSSSSNSIITIIEDIYACVKFFEDEKKLAIVQMLQKKNVFDSVESINIPFSEVLTPGAYFYISKELSASKSDEFVMKMIDPQYFQIMTDKGFVMASPKACTCSFYLSMQLPCQHIFMVRKKLDVPLFDESLINRRWTKKYLLQHLKTCLEQTNGESMASDTTYNQFELETAQSKLQHAKELTDEILDLLSSMDHSNIDANVKLLMAYKELLLKQRSYFVRQQISEVEKELRYLPKVCEPDITSSQPQEDSKHATFTHKDFDGRSKEVDYSPEIKRLKNRLAYFEEIVSLKSEEHDKAQFLSNTTVSTNFYSPNLYDSTFVTKEGKSPRASPFKSEPESSILVGIDRKEVIKAEPLKRISETSLGLIQRKKRLKAHFIFAALPTEEKIQSIIDCFLSNERYQKPHVIKIKASEIEKNIQNIPNKVLEMIKMIDISLLKKHFTDDAWELIENIISEKEKNIISICSVCSKDIFISCITCDSCLDFFHLKCVGLKVKPTKRKWVCIKCLFVTD